jgi:transketolase
VRPQQSPEVTAAKLRGAGFDVQIIDGHNPTEIQQALREHTAHSQISAGKPFAMVARTIKDWGFSSVLGSNMHGQPVAKDDKARALADLDVVAQQVGAVWTGDDLRIAPIPAAAPPRAEPVRRAPSFIEASRQVGHEKVIETGKLATRKAYGMALQALWHANPRIVALDGDVRNSTYAENFANDPALRDRFFECKIAEQHMISCAGGLAAGGKLPFVSTFGKFVTRGHSPAVHRMTCCATWNCRRRIS